MSVKRDGPEDVELQTEVFEQSPPPKRIKLPKEDREPKREIDYPEPIMPKVRTGNGLKVAPFDEFKYFQWEWILKVIYFKFGYFKYVTRSQIQRTIHPGLKGSAGSNTFGIGWVWHAIRYLSVEEDPLVEFVDDEGNPIKVGIGDKLPNNVRLTHSGRKLAHTLSNRKLTQSVPPANLHRELDEWEKDMVLLSQQQLPQLQASPQIHHHSSQLQQLQQASQEFAQQEVIGEVLEAASSTVTHTSIPPMSLTEWLKTASTIVTQLNNLQEENLQLKDDNIQLKEEIILLKEQLAKKDERIVELEALQGFEQVGNLSTTHSQLNDHDNEQDSQM